MKVPHDYSTFCDQLECGDWIITHSLKVLHTEQDLDHMVTAQVGR